MTSTPLSYSLGADDISKIVDAILPKLSPFLSKLTNDKQYVALHKAVLSLSKGKTFTNKEELDDIVKDIVMKIVNAIFSKKTTIANTDGRFQRSCGTVCIIKLCTCSSSSCPSLFNNAFAKCELVSSTPVC